jgi:homoserine kinase
VAIHVRVPATSANLGPGFDVLGLALALHNEAAVEESDTIAVSVEGLGEGRLPSDGSNILVEGVRLAFAAAGRPFRGAAVRSVNRIPLGRGLGSSAAAWVAGLIAGNALCGSPLDRDALLALAVRAEGHPDNVAAALLGGLTVSAALGDRVIAVRLPVPPAISWVVLVPAMESSTREARAVLPAAVPRADAIFNLQRLGLLLAALTSGDPALLPDAMDDRLHQPYRQHLFPWFVPVAKAAREAGALSCVLSGAGPSMLAAATRNVERVARGMEAALRAEGAAGTACVLPVDLDGATWRAGPWRGPHPVTSGPTGAASGMAPPLG